MRRVPSIDALIPVLYLKGISTGDFSEALEAILGPKAAGLSATNIVRLKEGLKADYEAWAARDLSTKRFAYWWADGIYFNVRLDPERPCLLVLMGALEDGTKELVAVWDGIRESKASCLCQEADPRDVFVADQRESFGGVSAISRGVRSEMSESDGMPAQGRRYPVHVFTIFRQNTGGTCERRIRLNRRSPRSATGPDRRRAAARERRR